MPATLMAAIASNTARGAISQPSRGAGAGRGAQGDPLARAGRDTRAAQHHHAAAGERGGGGAAGRRRGLPKGHLH